MTQRICVTGASGQAGRAVVHDLLEHGYDVAATDIAVSKDDIFDGMLRADLTDYGQAIEALEGADAVVHLANIPAPGIATQAVTFNTNVSKCSLTASPVGQALTTGSIGLVVSTTNPDIVEVSAPSALTAGFNAQIIC